MKLPKEEIKGLNEVGRDKKLRSLAISYVKEEPGAFVVRTAKKFFLQYKSQTVGVGWSGFDKTSIGQSPGAVTFAKLVSSGYWAAFLGCWVTGGVLLWKRCGFLKMVIHPAVSLAVGYSVIQAIIVIQDRYVLSWAGVMVPLAAYGLCWWMKMALRKFGAEDSAEDIACV